MGAEGSSCEACGGGREFMWVEWGKGDQSEGNVYWEVEEGGHFRLVSGKLEWKPPVRREEDG